jgi:hypothetical protein
MLAVPMRCCGLLACAHAAMLCDCAVVVLLLCCCCVTAGLGHGFNGHTIACDAAVCSSAAMHFLLESLSVPLFLLLLLLDYQVYSVILPWLDGYV